MQTTSMTPHPNCEPLRHCSRRPASGQRTFSESPKSIAYSCSGLSHVLDSNTGHPMCLAEILNRCITFFMNTSHLRHLSRLRSHMDIVTWESTCPLSPIFLF